MTTVLPPAANPTPTLNPYEVLIRTTPIDLRELEEFERDRLLDQWTTPVDPQPIYFPPAAPVFGAPLPASGLYADEIARTLAPYVTEPFYAPLSTRVAEEDLGRRARERLDEYREQKARELRVLRERLEQTRHLAPAERRAALAGLAAEQDPVLEELEVRADELRREFFRLGLFSGGGDWNHHRVWRLTPADVARDHPEIRLRELRVLRAAIYYQEGLSLEQRRLLREVVMELAAELNVPGAGLTLPDNEHAQIIFFSPHTARLPLPDNLPRDLAALLADYNGQKGALKRELRERLVAVDADRNATRRARSLQTLAAEQTARLAGLEQLAEEIREKFAPLIATFAPPPAPELPGALEERVAAYLRDKNELQRIAQEKLAAALAAFDEREKHTSGRARGERRATLVRETVEAFHATHAERINALNREAAQIRGALVQHSATRADAGAGKSIDALMRDFAEAFKQQQLASLYTEYRIAMLEPGLSPAQRRLLFDAAITDLKLPGAIRDQQAMPDERLSRP